ncbi:MAG: glycosyltransferase family 9 protein [Victivallales bacterium]
MNSSNKAFLICHRGALGDFILTWPAICLLRRHFPEYKFTGLGRPDYMKLAVKLGILEEFHDSDSPVMPNFFEEGIFPKELGGPEKGVIWLKDARKTAELLKRNSNCDFAPVEPFPAEKIHVAKFHIREILKYLKMKGSFNPVDLTPEYLFTPKDIIYIHPGSGSLKKNYSPDFYLELAKFAEMHFKKEVKFILGPVEMEKGAVKFFPAGKTLAPENASALADVLGGAYLYIGNDSGASHLSAFLGMPTVAIYRSSDPEIWGVLGRKVKWLKGSKEYALLKELIEKIQEPFNWAFTVSPAGLSGRK